jgi:hypothetical protein
VVRSSQNRHERNSKTIGKVHGSCVISEENAKGLNPLDQIYRANLRFSVEPLKDFGCEVPVITITDHSVTPPQPGLFSAALTRARTDDKGGFRKPLPYVFAARRTVGQLRFAAVLSSSPRARAPVSPVERTGAAAPGGRATPPSRGAAGAAAPRSRATTESASAARSMIP